MRKIPVLQEMTTPRLRALKRKININTLLGSNNEDSLSAINEELRIRQKRMEKKESQ